MPILLKIHPKYAHNAVSFGRYNFSVERNKPVYLEDEALEYPDIKKAISAGYCIAETGLTEFPGTLNNPVSNCLSSKLERDQQELEKENQRKQEAKERELALAMQKFTKDAGAEFLDRGTSFAHSVSVKCKLGFGIAIFDSDIIKRNAPEDFCWYTSAKEYLFGDDFLDFAKENGIFITEWVAEDCRQLWLVSAKHYFETSSNILVNFKEADKTDTIPSVSLGRAYNKLKLHMESTFNVEMPELYAEWLLHLYYE